MARPDPDELSMAELVQRTKADFDMTWSDMAEQLGRSDRMVRKIARGETTGESYRRSLTELYSRGEVEHLTPRRRTKDGKLAPVRSKRGTDEKSHVPDDTRGVRAAPVKRGRYSSRTQHFGHGNRRHVITMPRSENTTKGRERGLGTVVDKLRSVTRSQARKDKRVGFKVTMEDEQGQRRTYEIGSKSGYHSSDVTSDIRSIHGGNVESWISSQMAGHYPDVGGKLVGVEMQEFNASRSKDERKAADAAGTRRRRRR